MSMTRLAAAACCALGASAGAPGLDAAGLVQSDLRIHGPGEAGATKDVSLQRLTSGSYKVKSKTLVKGLVRAFLSDGRRWSNLLWGNATASVPGARDPAGCSAEDGQTAHEHFQKLKGDFMNHMQDKLPEIMKQMQGGGNGSPFGNAPAIPFATPFGDGNNVPDQEVSISVGDLVDLPQSCSSVMGQQGDLVWSGILSCVKEAFGVSTPCANCFSQFGKQVSDACGGMCMVSLNEGADILDNGMAGVEGKLTKSGGNNAFGGSMPSQQDMMEAAHAMNEVMANGLKKLAPCAECVTPKATSFAGCMGGEEAAAQAEEVGKEIVEGLKNGDLMQVQVGESSKVGDGEVLM